MLEHKALWLAPWSGGERSILAENYPAGVARWRRPPSPLAWLGPAIVEVVENEDESLVFTVQRRFLPRGWDVADAEGRLLGSLRRDRVVDRFGFILAGREPGRLRVVEGLDAGSWSKEGGGVRLTFGSPLEDSPFLRMLVLAAALLD